MIQYIGYAITPGHNIRKVCQHADAMAALEITKRSLRKGEDVSVNRKDVPQPSLRASELMAGVGQAMSKIEVAKMMSSSHAASLASARYAKRKKRDKW